MEKKVSKSLTWLLRHGAVKENIKMNEEGYVNIVDILAWLKGKYNIVATMCDLESIARADTKNRFRIEGDTMRANQGHSIDIKIPMEKYEQTNSQIVHGTYKKNMESILETGLKSMSRTHVHLINIDSSTDKYHMIRQDTDLYVFIKPNKELEFNMSSNGVVLTESVPKEYLTFVPAYEHKKSGCYGFIIFNADHSEVLTVTTTRGTVGFPKGKKKKGEFPLACAFRELKEETDLDPEDITILDGCKSEINEKGNVPTNYYLAEIRNTHKKLYCADEDENLTVSWMKIDELTELPPDKFYKRRLTLIL